MLQALEIALAAGKRILESINASKRPTIESPAIMVSELIGVPVNTRQGIMRSIRLRGPDYFFFLFIFLVYVNMQPVEL